MPGGGIQRLLFGQLVVRLVRVGFGGLAVVVPDAEDAAHGDVQLAVCGVVHLPGQFQHPEDLIVHLNGCDAGVVVDGLDIHHAVIIVVDVVETVVFQQVGVEGVHLTGELLLAVAIGNDLRDSVEGIIEDGAVPLGVGAHARRGGFLGRAAGGEDTEAERPGQQSGNETLDAHACSFAAAVKEACSSDRWASRSPKTQFLLDGVTTALRGMITCACFMRSSRVSRSFSLKFASTSAGG